jgi:hypothetical protein
MTEYLTLKNTIPVPKAWEEKLGAVQPIAEKEITGIKQNEAGNIELKGKAINK